MSGEVSKYLRKTEVIVFLRLGGAVLLAMALSEEEPKAMSVGSEECGRSDISIMAFGSISTNHQKQNELINK